MNNANKEVIMKNRIIIIGVVAFLCFLVIVLRISYLQLHDTKASLIELEKLSTKEVYGASMPRGKIYDRNYTGGFESGMLGMEDPNGNLLSQQQMMEFYDATSGTIKAKPGYSLYMRVYIYINHRYPKQSYNGGRILCRI